LILEWLSGQAARGYVEHEAGRFKLPEEQAMALAHEDSPVLVAGGAGVLASMFLDKDKLVAAMRGDGALSWADHHPCLFSGTERFFRPGYRSHLIAEWLPALDGVVPRLERGAKVADIGCGFGAAMLIMALSRVELRRLRFPWAVDRTGPAARCRGRRGRPGSIHSSQRAVLRRRRLRPGLFFDCLHDMGDPVGAARRAHRALKPDGTVLLVEPFADDDLDENANPVGRLFYAASTCICTPNSLSQDGKRGLGAQAGERRLRQVFAEAGFRHFRRATQTPFNLVPEARK
jgi:SAM-dependent methyltransferase